MASQPILLLTFANDEDAHLDMLKAESSAVYDALEDIDNEGIVEVKREESATLDIIANRIAKYQNDICIFHYSGHASGQHLELEDTTANADGLANLIASAPNIQLVVLNGCASYGQVELLLELGVKAVIATTTAIGDTKAKEFSEQFYNALGQKKTIQESFNLAIAYLETKYSDFKEKVNKPKKGLKLKRKPKKEEQDALPWGLYYEDTDILEWKLNQDLKFKGLLREGSQKYFDRLWNNRYEFLEISEQLIPSVSTDLVTEEELSQSQQTPLATCIQKARNSETHHLFVSGPVGYGKTVNLLQLWQSGLTKIRWNTPVPIYIDLSEYNSTSYKEDFILNYIALNYLGKKRPSDEDFNLIWQILKTPIKSEPFIPSVLLLLDGIDEIITDSTQFIKDIKHLERESKGCQTVVTSSTEFLFTWVKTFHSIKFNRLSSEQVDVYLKASNLEVPTSKRLLDFLDTPMILSLYTTSSTMTQQYKDDKRLDFKTNINTYSELVWNFTEAVIAQISKELDNSQFMYIKFMIRHFMPFVAYQMEKKEKYFLTVPEMRQAIADASEYLYNVEFLTSFPDYIFSFRNFNLEAKDWLQELERFNHKINFITKKLRIIVLDEYEGQEIYQFTQRQYRSFHSAVHICNDLKTHLKQDKLPPTLSERRLSAFNTVGLQIGELCEEYNNTVEALVSRRTWKKVTPTLLDDTLEKCRGQFKAPKNPNTEARNVVWNILSIWKRSRKHFAGTDLSQLDLSDFIFDEHPLRHLRRMPVHPAKLNNSLLNSKNFISQGHTKGVNAVAYHPTGKKILSVSIDNTVKEWSTSTSKCIQTLRGHKDSVTCIAYHPDGTKAISGSNDGTIIEWDLEKGQDIRVYEGHEAGISTLAYLPNGKQFLSGSQDNTVKLWTVKSGRNENTYTKFKVSIALISVHPSGKRFIASTRENAFQEWDIETGESTQLFVGHSMPVEGIDYSPDGSRVISCAYDASINEWDTATGECLQTLNGHLGPVTRVIYHPSNNHILSCGRDSTVKEWDLTTGENTFSLSINGVSCLDFHPRGRQFIAGSWNNMIHEWNTRGRRLNVFEGYSNQVTSIACSPDGKFLISGASDNTIRKWDIAAGRCIHTIEGHQQTINSVAFSPDNKFILSASEDKTIKLWLNSTGQCFRTFEGHEAVVKSICFHKDNRTFISGSYDKTIREWDIRTGNCLKTFTKKEGMDVVNAVIYNHDYTRIASAHNDSLIRIWDIATGERIRTLGEDDTGHSLMVYAIAYSSDGKLLASGSEDRTVKIWETASGHCIKTFEGHTHPIESVSFSADGSRMISASRDKTIREWDIDTGTCLQVLEGHFDGVNEAIYTADGQFIFSGALDNLIKKWKVFSNENIENPKDKLGEKRDKSIAAKKKVEDKKEEVKGNSLKDNLKIEGSIFDTFSKLTGRITETVKKVVIHHKDNSIQTLVSASGLHVQGADFRNLHKKSKFSNEAKDMLRQYGAIFSDEDKEIWDGVIKRVK